MAERAGLEKAIRVTHHVSTVRATEVCITVVIFLIGYGPLSTSDLMVGPQDLMVGSQDCQDLDQRLELERGRDLQILFTQGQVLRKKVGWRMLIVLN